MSSHFLRSIVIRTLTIGPSSSQVTVSVPRLLPSAVKTWSYPQRQPFSYTSRTRSILEPKYAPIDHDAVVSKSPKRKPVRITSTKRSLRRVAVEAQRSRDIGKEIPLESEDGTDTITAICGAEEYDMAVVAHVLRSHGFSIDPHGTDFLEDQVIHAKGVNSGDIFVFPSGTLVAWSLEEDVAVKLATVTLLPAALNPHAKHELEDLEFKEDSSRDSSGIRGDIITLGTKASSDDVRSQLDTTLAKIAFSSGLARSTKLGILENLLGAYFDSTRQIPRTLSMGARLPSKFSRSFLLQKTGELLELRAQLNHYSELTDSLPDLFWDSRHDLGLEGYFDQVGRALDVNDRIRTLNQKMDYAQEIATIMRETLSEKHSIHLEWIIIILIAVEVAFGVRAIWNERRETSDRSTDH